MEEKKQELIEAINSIENEKVLDYLLQFSESFILIYDSPQI